MAVRLRDGASQAPGVRVQGERVGSYPRLAPEAGRGSVRRITVLGEEILSRRSQPVTEFGTPGLSRLVDDMFTTLYVAEGAGLAASQVDVDLRLFVWDCADEWGVRHVGHIANPVLDELPAAGRRLLDEGEGCLSVPGPSRTVPRPDHAVVRGFDLNGDPLVIEGFGYFARCLQHETEHLQGRLYLDRLDRRERKGALREMAASRDDVFARRAERAKTLGG